MEDQFDRTIALLGAEAVEKLKAARVAVFGIGGVGGACAEALARSGIGLLDLYDNDVVTITNLNRQIVALHSTLGRYKADVMAERIKDINPMCDVRTYKVFYSPETSGGIDLSGYDYVVDAIDTVVGKVELIVRAKAMGVRIICSMGAGNRIDPTKFAVTDIGRTETDPLAKAVRKELRARGITGVKVVYSTEKPSPVSSPSPARQPQPVIAGSKSNDAIHTSRTPPASNAFVPPACGLALASEVIKDLIHSS
jgi:tRNA A37 threonylcarbamoyladenosine dehydratase